MSEPTLEFEDLKLAYMVRGTAREVLRGVSFAIQPGEAYGLVGESGVVNQLRLMPQFEVCRVMHEY